MPVTFLHFPHGDSDDLDFRPEIDAVWKRGRVARRDPAHRRRKSESDSLSESDSPSYVGRKVCTVTGLDPGACRMPCNVEAGSLFEAEAAGLEALHQKKCPVSAVQVTVQEPGKQYRIHPRQLERWLRTDERADNIGVQAQAARPRDAPKQSDSVSGASREPRLTCN